MIVVIVAIIQEIASFTIRFNTLTIKEIPRKSKGFEFECSRTFKLIQHLGFPLTFFTYPLVGG